MLTLLLLLKSFAPALEVQLSIIIATLVYTRHSFTSRRSEMRRNYSRWGVFTQSDGTLRLTGRDNVEQGDAVFIAWATCWGWMWCCMAGFAINQLLQLNRSELPFGAWSEEDRSRIAISVAIFLAVIYVGYAFLFQAFLARWWDPRQERLLREIEERQRRRSRPSGMTAQADLERGRVEPGGGQQVQSGPE
jgi:hypothetical protein